jgi:hypothetical protein
MAIQRSIANGRCYVLGFPTLAAELPVGEGVLPAVGVVPGVLVGVLPGVAGAVGVIDG